MKRRDKRAAVMKATLKLVAEYGFHGAPMALIAEQADVSPATIYHYFQSKEDLIAKTFAELEQRTTRTVTKKYREDWAISDRFCHISRALLRYLVSSPMESKFIEQFHNSPYGIEHRRERIFGTDDSNVVIKLFNEAKEKMIVKDLPLPVLLALSFGPLLVMARDHRLGFVDLDDGLIEPVLAGCWDAIRC